MSMSQSHVSTTERLIIRRFNESDLPVLAGMLADPEVMKFSVNGVMSLDATKRFLDGCLTLYETRGIASWALESRSTGEFLGFAGLTPGVRDGREEIDLGYRLARPHWGQGFATEAAATIVDHGFRVLRLNAIFCTIVPEHVDSLRVAEKLGFSFYETAQAHGMQVRVYKMNSHEWVSPDAGSM